MRIYDFIDYKEFVRRHLSKLPRQGRGQYAKLAEIAQTHKATISQIFNGNKDLSPEQAFRIASYFELTAKETSYFLLLVNYSRSGSDDLRNLYKKQIEKEKAENQEIIHRLVQTREFTQEERSIFFSNWMYSAIRVLSSINGFQKPQEMAKRLRLPVDMVKNILDTLAQTGLCVQKNGQYSPGPQNTFISSKSPLASRHHGNWRIKAMERHPVLNPIEELAYTAPVSLSSVDVLKIREILIKAIEQSDKIVGPSACERLFCINIDWFEVQ